MSNSIAKSYNSIKELPSEVRSSFDERDQEKWMDAYNKASENKDPEDAKVDAWMSMVDAPSSLAVETWGSVEVRDADGELVPVKTIEEYADKFIENGGLMHDSHSNVPVGTVWDYEVRKHPETGQDGIVFYFNIYRDGEVFERARDDILSGRKNAVSIGAEAPRGGYKCDDRGCYVERDVTDLYELSICETPANPEAYFINVGKDIAKAKQPIKGEVFRIGIQDYIVHQDYTTCPLQKCKHDLLDKGFRNVHLTKNGIVTAKATSNEYRLFNAIYEMGFPFRYDLKKEQFEIMPDYGVEQAIEEAVENGWAHEDQVGHICLTKEIPKEVFIDWYERGFIVKIGDFYCLKADDVAKDYMNKSKKRPDGQELYDMLVSIDTANDGPWIAFTESLTQMTNDAMQRFNLAPEYEEIVRDFFYDVPGEVILADASDLQYAIDQRIRKKVRKDGGAMGVGDAGASNPVYGSKPTSLVTPTGDKKYGKKKKTKKEFTDDGNIHAVGSRQTKTKKVKKSYGNYYDAIENFIVDSPEGVYYNEILDEFADVFDEDDVLDALEQICQDGGIFYNENTERFAVAKTEGNTMHYLPFNHIAKKCPKGTWMDKKTGECIPIEEWKSKYGSKDKANESKEESGNDSPKEEPSKDGMNVNTAKDLDGLLDKFRKKHNLNCEVGMSNGTIAIRVDPTTRRSTMSKYLEFIKDFAEKNNLQIDPTGGNYYLRLGSKEDIENNNKILQEKRAKESEERKKQKESRKAEWEKKESEKSDAWKSAELDGAIQLIESIGNARENFYAIKVPNLEIEARFFKDNFSKDSDEEEADEFRGKETPPIPDMKSGLSSSSDSLVIDEDSYVAYDDNKDRAYAYDKKKKKWAVIQNFSRYLDGDIEDILNDESTVMP